MEMDVQEWLWRDLDPQKSHSGVGCEVVTGYVLGKRKERRSRAILDTWNVERERANVRSTGSHRISET
jgi:hypothetical protein